MYNDFNILFETKYTVWGQGAIEVIVNDEMDGHKGKWTKYIRVIER